MGKGTYKSISDLITQGYKIIDSNTVFAGEPWEIVDPVLSEFDTAFHNLRDANESGNVANEHEGDYRLRYLNHDFYN